MAELILPSHVLRKMGCSMFLSCSGLASKRHYQRSRSLCSSYISIASPSNNHEAGTTSATSASRFISCLLQMQVIHLNTLDNTSHETPLFLESLERLKLLRTHGILALVRLRKFSKVTGNCSFGACAFKHIKNSSRPKLPNHSPRRTILRGISLSAASKSATCLQPQKAPKTI